MLTHDVKSRVHLLDFQTPSGCCLNARMSNLTAAYGGAESPRVHHLPGTRWGCKWKMLQVLFSQDRCSEPIELGSGDA